MERIFDQGKPGLLVAAWLALAAVGSAAPPPDHTSDLNGRLHAEDNDLPYSSHCTDCHAPDLLGGIGPSCRTCHGILWNAQDVVNATPPVDHTIEKGDGAMHKAGFGDPIANDCTRCHGPNLDDGFATSCFTCHGEIWAGGGPPPDHTELKGGFAEHKPGFGTPVASECTQCHGLNLNDGFATSCFTCHGQIWAGGGPPPDHTELKGGFAEHKPGFGTPVASECTQCHGPNLNDGFAPSCFTCHDRIWAGEGPPADHTELKGGFAEHKPGFEDPFANSCTQCHGPNLNDGFAPSCFACHGPLWGGNSPPSVDPGGPYAGGVAETVHFDASGTVDADGDSLTYQWDFGDGSPPTSPSPDPTASHSYDAVGAYLGSLTVDDGVNDPVVEPFTVEISDSPPCPNGDRWLVTTTSSPPETFTVTFHSYGGALSAVKDDGVNPPSLAIGMEFQGIIFWMDMWLDIAGNVFWGTGDIFFGNIDRDAGTMTGIVFDDQGGVATFTGSENP